MSCYIGSCHCGKNRYEIKAQPEFQFVCYCNNCKVLNSGGHLCGMMFDQAQLTEATDTTTYHYVGGSGDNIVVHFCPTCATQLYAYPTHYQGKVVIRANTLVEGEFTSQQHIFTESAFPWDQLPIDK